MIAKPEEKAVAIRLRMQGLSYNEIRKQVPVSKSILSSWLKAIPLAPEHRARLYTKQVYILSLGSQSQRERRIREVAEIIETAKQEVVVPIADEALRLMGAALYWAEGSKTGLCEITNSDPHLIYFFVEWVQKFFGIPSTGLRARLNIYPQQDDAKIKEFWSDITGIPVENFGKSFVKPFSTGYKKNNLYYGTIKVEVPKSVDIKHKIFGWIAATLQNNDRRITLTQKKWQSLADVQRPINLTPPIT